MHQQAESFARAVTPKDRPPDYTIVFARKASRPVGVVVLKSSHYKPPSHQRDRRVDLLIRSAFCGIEIAPPIRLADDVAGTPLQ